jgi:hypothetical protein
MSDFSERLWPAPWLFLATALVIPASLLVFLPINLTVGIIVAIVLYAGCVGLLLLGSPTIRVTGSTLVAGKARLPLDVIAGAEAFRTDAARAQRGPALDARAYLVIRGWVDPVVRVTLDDPTDPVPYWLISTRRPEDLARVLTAAVDGAAPGEATAGR